MKNTQTTTGESPQTEEQAPQTSDPGEAVQLHNPGTPKSGDAYSVTDPHTGSNSPQRVQRSRRRGWRIPPDTICVSRPSRFGNPFPVEDHGRESAVAMYRQWIQQPTQAELLADARQTLRGQNLACWCRPGVSCHADVLLALVNEPLTETDGVEAGVGHRLHPRSAGEGE